MKRFETMRFKTIRRAAVRALRLSILAGTLAVFAAGSDALARALCRISPLLFATSLVERSASPDGAFGRAFDLSTTFGAVAFGVASAVFLASIWRRRFFCRYCCPLGTALDAAAFGRKRLTESIFRLFRRERTSRAARFWGSGANLGAKFAFVGRSLAVAALLAAAFGWRFDVGSTIAAAPLAFDPTSLLSRWTAKGFALDATLIAFCASFVVSVYFWRFDVCPCGAAQDFAYFLPRRLVGIVRAVVRRRTRAVASGTSDSNDSTPEKSSARRRFLRESFWNVAAVAFCVVALKKARAFCSDALFGEILPPNAAPGDEYAAKCARCGRCVAACPTKLLRFGPGEVPVADFADGAFCEQNCVACASACPTGAIRPLRLPEKKSVRLATVEFNLERCLLYYQRECSVCRRECPYEAIDFVWSEAEYATLPVVDAERCVGCGRCVAFCPGEPVFDELDADGTLVRDPSGADAFVRRPKALTLKTLKTLK